MAKKTVRDLKDVAGRRMFVRVDYNVPVEGGKITDDTRIRASLPTLQHLIAAGARLVLASHLGRPKKGPSPEFSLAPVAVRLSELLGRPVGFAPDCVGTTVTTMSLLMTMLSFFFLDSTSIAAYPFHKVYRFDGS
jgi:phosphoglycerate kinase